MICIDNQKANGDEFIFEEKTLKEFQEWVESLKPSVD